MSFDAKATAIGTSDTVLFECPAVLGGSVHGLVISNNSDSAITLTLRFFDKSEGTNTLIRSTSVPAKGDYVFPKPINVAPGDRISASASTAGALVAMNSSYLAEATPIAKSFNPRGEWNPEATYNPLDVISFEGSSYVAVAPNTDRQPPEGAWMLLASQGGKSGVHTVQGVEPDEDNNVVLPTATNLAEGLMSATDKGKLDGVATGATKNQTDAHLLSRANHTGTQPISTVKDLQSSLDLLAPIASPTFTGTVSGVTKAMVGLGNVDNTSDANKPVSTATQTQLNNKVDKVAGKALSTNDFTTALKTKLEGVEVGAQKNPTPVDNTTSTSSNLPLSANQGRVLKGFIDNINTVLQSDDSTLDDLQEIVNFIKMNRATLETLGIGNIAGLVDALAGKVDTSDSRLTNSREWTASTMSQAEAQAGTATTRRAVTAQRIRQAILGWWNNSAEKTKLDGIAEQATKNATDAELRDRSTHTGSQEISTVTGLQGALDSKVDKVEGKQLSTEDFTTPEKTKLANIILDFPKVKPSLRLDFVNQKKLDPRINFTRASDATYWDSFGALQTVGPNEPRFDYDPATGECRGLLVEGQATNLIPSSTFGTSFNVTFPGSHVDIGDLSIDLFIENSESGAHYVNTSSITREAGKTYTESFFVKSHGRQIYIFSSAAVWGGASVSLRADLDNGVVASTSNTDKSGIEPIGNGVYRVWFTVTAQESGSASWRIYLHNGSSFGYQGDGASGVYLGGIQTEEGSAPTSYIPTEGSQVTRVQEIALITPGDWFNPIEGTFIVDFIAPGASGFNTLIGMGSATQEEFRFGYGYADDTRFRIVVNDGDGQKSTPPTLLQPGNRYKAAATFKPVSGGIEWKCAVAGTVIGSVVTPGMPTGFVENGIAIGRRRPNSNTLNWNGTAASISYYHRALQDAALESLTAL